MSLRRLLDEIFADAKRNGLTRAEVVKSAGLHDTAVSRMLRTGDCRLSSIEKLAKAAGLRLTVVTDTDDAAKLMKGELF